MDSSGSRWTGGTLLRLSPQQTLLSGPLPLRTSTSRHQRRRGSVSECVPGKAIDPFLDTHEVGGGPLWGWGGNTRYLLTQSRRESSE